MDMSIRFVLLTFLPFTPFPLSSTQTTRRPPRPMTVQTRAQIKAPAMEKRVALRPIDVNATRATGSTIGAAKKRGGASSGKATIRAKKADERPRSKNTTSTPSSSRPGSTTGDGAEAASVASTAAKKPAAEEISRAKFDAVARTRVGENAIDLIGDDPLGDDDLGGIVVEEWSLADFEYVGRLGSGGSATVFRARERQSGHEVALKVQEAEGYESYAGGREEIDVHLPLEHPSVVRMIDYFYSDAPFGPATEGRTSDRPKLSLYMILELCDGGSLVDVVRAADARRLDEERAAAYFRGALLAIEHVHRSGLIHCDCKTANLLVHSGEVKLADFGMAVRFEEREVVGGSPIYMSPEHLQAWREFGDNFDHRVDIYSLGVVLFEILVGKLPYDVVLCEEDGDSLLAGVGKLGIDGANFIPPILDLRKLDDQTAEGAFELPPPRFPNFVCDKAKDLILRLMEPCPAKRISVSEAKEHPWLQKRS